MTFDEWLVKHSHGPGGVSPKHAWNAALDEAIRNIDVYWPYSRIDIKNKLEKLKS